ncbi:MAG: hypothetical protein GX249_11240 [Firmicutes bacterium]|nr:hypothetical protein [Bacillota bacterium]
MMKTGAVSYAFRVMMQRILGFLLFYLGAPLALSWHVWVYFGISFAAALLSLGIRCYIRAWPGMETMPRKFVIA